MHTFAHMLYCILTFLHRVTKELDSEEENNSLVQEVTEVKYVLHYKVLLTGFPNYQVAV